MGYDQWFDEHMFMIAPAARLRRAVAAELPRIPAAAEARQLQPRPRDGSGDQAAAAAASDAALDETLSSAHRAAPAGAGAAYIIPKETTPL